MIMLMYVTDRDDTERTGCPNCFHRPHLPSSRKDFANGKSLIVFGADCKPAFTSEISRRGVGFAPLGAIVDHFGSHLPGCVNLNCIVSYLTHCLLVSWLILLCKIRNLAGAPKRTVR
jgi:hypothetical protein